MKGDFIDIISNCPYEMHNSLSDEDYSKIIYDLKDDHKELIYFLYLRDFTTNQLADRQGQDFPFTGEERDFLSRHAKDLPTALEKLDKEKLAIIKKIGVMVRKIAREQAKLKTKQDKNNANDKKAV